MASSSIFLACVVIALFSSCLAKPFTLEFEVEYDGNVTALNAHDSTRHGDCKSLLQAGYNASGVYWLSLEDRHVLIPCEFRDGNAYTVITRRYDGTQSFVMPWRSYEAGFGHPVLNYWAGLQNIYALTQRGNHVLQINMQDWSRQSRNAVYTHVYLESRDVRYRLHVGPFTGNVPDMLSYHNNMPFSTYDAPDPSGCASHMKAGWWYNYCAYALLTGHYYKGGPYTPSGTMYDGIFWQGWRGYNYSLKFVSMTLSS